eukprot:CAMPEP_0174334048 /NCGR_PEP_ID=MMETSP0810-20121108/19629_1 /TAXON_ID=73025 ORGANISM="Eutreptiella gymnastica-like, Strain CCMP1594" /NCGR_SAMPLE_ID=MMETSP0810 /ASSEMBLY_ACC=CAM_ASM_000659 /LENGTH=125 /DNA_ID=CAMNT_0015451509 /DNA_START=25 /DNA_END=398 /DNA_ORIENTATION=-
MIRQSLLAASSGGNCTHCPLDASSWNMADAPQREQCSSFTVNSVLGWNMCSCSSGNRENALMSRALRLISMKRRPFRVPLASLCMKPSATGLESDALEKDRPIGCLQCLDTAPWAVRAPGCQGPG